MSFKKFKKNSPEEVSEMTEEVVKEPNEKVERIKTQVRDFVKTYQLAFLGFFIMLVLFFIGSMITSTERNIISAATADIYAYDNNLNLYDQRSKDTVSAMENVTLDSSRWKNDDASVLSYITDAFEHENPTLYYEHVEKYTDLSVNIALMQEEYFDVKGPVYDNQGNYIHDASDLVSSKINSFESYVLSVEGQKYTYVSKVELYQNIYDSAHRTMFGTTLNLILTYSCDKPVGSNSSYNVDIIDLKVDWLY